ncbi:beta-lactamase, partial [Achlya hypogyna]
MENQLQTHTVPGFALSVVYDNQTVIAQGFGTKQYGNASNVVTADTQFQIGSYSKTFIALSIAKLVDEKRLSWTDTVKSRLPWFSFVDKYAEKFTTLADLLAMNSVFGDHEGDLVWSADVYPTERDAVKALGSFNTTRRLRPGYAYSNMNYEILGQVLEYQTNTSWASYVNATFWHPLGMTKTFGRTLDSTTPQDLTFGHRTCNGKVAGPYDLRTSPAVALGQRNGYLSAGSIISTVADLAKFSRFLLNKGAGIYSSPDIVSTLITGQVINTNDASHAEATGYTYNADGGVLAAGYGFDVVGDVMYGHHYFDKGGDTAASATRNGFVPNEQLGVVLIANAQSMGGSFVDLLLPDRMRSYIVGLFLDMPVTTLKQSYDKAVAAASAMDPLGACDAHTFEGVPMEQLGSPVPSATQALLVGTYANEASPAFYTNMTLLTKNGNLYLQYGPHENIVYAKANSSTTFLLLSEGEFDIADVGTAPTMIDYFGVQFTKI